MFLNLRVERGPTRVDFLCGPDIGKVKVDLLPPVFSDALSLLAATSIQTRADVDQYCQQIEDLRRMIREWAV